MYTMHLHTFTHGEIQWKQDRFVLSPFGTQGGSSGEQCTLSLDEMGSEERCFCVKC